MRKKKTDMEVEESKQESNASNATADTPAAAPNMVDNNDLGDEDALLQQAIAMSMNDNQSEAIETPASGKGDSTETPAPAVTGGPKNDEEEDEDAAMQMALQMSMQADESVAPSEQPPQQFQDPQFVNQLLGSIPGVNTNDPAIRSALENYQSSNENKDGDEKKGNNDKKDDSKDKE